MKKYLALFLALVMLLLCVACSSGTASNAEPPATETPEGLVEGADDADDTAEPITLGVKSLEFVVAEADAEPEGFLVVADRGDAYHWQIGVDSFDALYRTCDLTLDQSTYVNVFVALENEEKYTYLYPEEGTWTAYVTADSISGWFNDEFQDGVVAAFNEWLQEVYSRFDYQTIRVATVDPYIEVSPDENYAATEEDMVLFKEYVNSIGPGYGFLSVEEVYNGIARNLGQSVASDAYQYLKAKVGDKIKNKADCGTYLKNIGVTNDGGVQETLTSLTAATYFDTAWWPGHDADFDVLTQLLAKGLTVTSASDSKWRLHVTNGGHIVAEASFNQFGVNHAFAIVAGNDGTLYWKAGLDDCEDVRSEYGLTGDDYIDLQVVPVLDQEKAEHSLPDGLNPSVTRYFAYFENDDAVTWALVTRDESEFPDWFTVEMQDEAMAAFAEWKAQVYAHVDIEDAFAMFPEEFTEIAAYTDEDIALLREYVTTLRAYEAEGVLIDNAIKESIAKTCGTTMIVEMHDYLKAKWRTVHTDCPTPCIRIGYCSYHGLVSFDSPTDIIYETTTPNQTGVSYALVGSFFSDISWDFSDTPDVYPFESVRELYDRNLVPYSDGTYWYFASGKSCDIIFAITETELLAG